MGNKLSTSNEPMDIKSLSSQIDDIAIHYILKQNTIDLLRLTDKEYYDNLILLVGNLFEKKLSDLEVGSMNQRIYPETIQNAVLDFLPSNGKLKETMIRNISKFYMKIMMIFSAIVATIDPQYSYEDEQGTTQLFYLKDLNSYKNIPRHIQPLVHQLTNPMNLCRKRISILRNKIDLSDPDFITINPGEKLCSTESTKHLTDEIGIKELDLLYYDIFDPTSKTWKHRSKEMEEKYQKDLFKFYTIFTGNEEMPPNIQSFKDIELFDYRSIGYCKDSLFTQDYVVPKEDELVVRYKEQLELLEKSTVLYRSELLEHLKMIFLTKIVDNNMSYTIDPSLTMDTIMKLETDTRTSIINLYTNCEQYFIRALMIFEELYENQSNNMNQSRITNIPLYKQQMMNTNTPRNSFNMTVKPNFNKSPENIMPLAVPLTTLPFLAPSMVPNAISPPLTVPKSLSESPSESPPATNMGIVTPPFPIPETIPTTLPPTFSNVSPAPFAPSPVSMNQVTNPPTNTAPISTPTNTISAPTNTISAPTISAPTNTVPISTPTNTVPISTPTNTVPMETAPIETAPIETAPIETAPIETAPIETAPIETAPIETAPIETAPIETAPIETAPIETAPIETAPMETAPTAPMETAPTAPVESSLTNTPKNGVPANSATVSTNAVPIIKEPSNVSSFNTLQVTPSPAPLQVTQSPIEIPEKANPLNPEQNPEQKPEQKPEEKKNSLLENFTNLFKK
jgi:hypothetical protein